jgi:hypothetical protein
LNAVVAAARANNVITVEQEEVALAFIASADAACRVFILIAGYSGFQP